MGVDIVSKYELHFYIDLNFSRVPFTELVKGDQYPSTREPCGERYEVRNQGHM